MTYDIIHLIRIVTLLKHKQTGESLSLPTTAAATHQPRLCKLFIAQKEEKPNEISIASQICKI